MRRRVKRIPDTIALKAATEFVTTSISIKDLQRKYDFKGAGSLYHWIRKFGLSQPNETELKTNEIMKNERSKTRHEQELEKKVKELEEQLEYQKLKARAYEKMVEIAEREFSISIKKKLGPKQ
jgi:transposase-like protein